MSERSTRTPAAKPNKLRRGIAALTLTAVAAGSEAIAGRLSAPEGISGHQATVAARNEVIAYEGAEQQAAMYSKIFTESLHKGQGVRAVRILEGTVYNEVDGKKVPVYRDPLVLTSLKEDSHDAITLLDGGFIGVQEAGPVDSITIESVPYYGGEKGAFTFVPDNAQQPVITADVYATRAHGSVMGPMLIAYDAQGNNQIQHPDGTPITPGLPLS